MDESSVVDFIYNGILTRVDGTKEFVGLRHNKKYIWCHCILRADSFYLPHCRRRIYFIGVRTDVGGTEELDKISAMIDSQMVKRPGTIADCLIGGSERMRGDVGMKRKLSQIVFAQVAWF